MAQPAGVLEQEILSPQEERIKQRLPIGLVSPRAQTKQARIQRMLEGFRDLPIQINVEGPACLQNHLEKPKGSQLF